MNKTFNIGQIKIKINQIKYKNVPTVTTTSSALASAGTCVCYWFQTVSHALLLGSVAVPRGVGG